MQAGSTAGRLVAVVVTYNRLDKLRLTLERLLASPPEELAAIVVLDNASRDGTAAFLAQCRDPRLHVLHEPVNRGGAGGFERGMRHAVQHLDPDWLMLSDDDACPDPGALAAFHRSDLTGWDAVAAAVYLPDGQICDMNRPSRNPFWHRRDFLATLLRGRAGFHLPPEAYRDRDPRPIDVTSFVGFFLSRRGVERTGYPDPGLFIYGDDGLYTLDLSARGGRICFDPRIRFTHDLSTFEGNRGRFHPLWKVYYYHRNLLLLYRAAAGWAFWPALLVVLPKWLSKTRSHGGARLTFLRLMGRAIRDGLARRTDVPHEQVMLWADPPRFPPPEAAPARRDNRDSAG